MKRRLKRLVMVLAVCAMSVFAVLASGCSLTDKIKEKIEQARCEHVWDDGEITKEATCIKVGELTKTCTLCDKTETEEIPLGGHTEITVPAVAQTCLTEGLTDGVKCKVCDKVIIKQQKLPALGHTEVIAPAVAPTCLTAGKTAGKHCSLCNDVLLAQKDIPATGHTVVTLEGKAPTCTEAGKTAGSKCSTCGDIFTEQTVIPANGHDEETFQEVIPVTCTTDGMTIGLRCRVCGINTVEPTVVEALGHFETILDPVPATCQSTGLTAGTYCLRCSEIFIHQEIMPLRSHNYDGEGNCIGCSSSMSDLVEYDPAEGDLIVGNWYRIYRRPTQLTSTYSYGFTLKGSCVEYDETGEEFSSVDCIVSIGVYPKNMAGSFYEKSGIITVVAYDSTVLELGSVYGIQTICHEDYVDICIFQDIYFNLEFSGGLPDGSSFTHNYRISVTSESTFISVGNVSSGPDAGPIEVKRLG